VAGELAKQGDTPLTGLSPALRTAANLIAEVGRTRGHAAARTLIVEALALWIAFGGLAAAGTMRECIELADQWISEIEAGLPPA
jgi:hypothetical protein